MYFHSPQRVHLASQIERLLMHLVLNGEEEWRGEGGRRGRKGGRGGEGKMTFIATVQHSLGQAMFTHSYLQQFWPQAKTRRDNSLVMKTTTCFCKNWCTTWTSVTSTQRYSSYCLSFSPFLSDRGTEGAVWSPNESHPSPPSPPTWIVVPLGSGTAESHLLGSPAQLATHLVCWKRGGRGQHNICDFQTM